MPDNQLAATTYKKLVADISRLYEGARKALVEAYWGGGQRIVLVEQRGEIRAAYGAGLLVKLSEDLTRRLGAGFSVENLKRMRRFYLENQKRSPATQLPLSHQIELLSVRDRKKRLELEKRAEEEALDRDGLRELIRHEKVRKQVAENLAKGPGSFSPELLKMPKFGLPGAYQIKDPRDTAWPDKNFLLLDHGFKGYQALIPGESRGLKAGDIVEWTGAKLLKTRRTVKDLYTYKAYLESVIDGDTFWVVLDTGMRGISRQKLRLRGIDCPEIDTKEGQAAKAFVEKILKGVPSLTVLSSKNATYDRYEADIIFTGHDGKEHYLNNLLLENGLAVRVGE